MHREGKTRRTTVRLTQLLAGSCSLVAAMVARAGEYAAGGEGGAIRIHDPAAGWNRLWYDVIFDITVIGVIFALVMAYFLVRYRRRPGGPTVGSAPKLHPLPRWPGW